VGATGFEPEIHHVKLLADSGEDTVENAMALCPNCHRESHFGINKD
jgi:5-methylcytosine-specific restriction enzyme A